jgi:hypothetical protein
VCSICSLFSSRPSSRAGQTSIVVFAAMLFVANTPRPVYVNMQACQCSVVQVEDTTFRSIASNLQIRTPLECNNSPVNLYHSHFCGFCGRCVGRERGPIRVLQSNARAKAERGACMCVHTSLFPPADSMAQRNQPAMGDSPRTPHSVSLKVLRYASL